MEAVKNKLGLDPNEMRPGNLHVDFTGHIEKWELDSFNTYVGFKGEDIFENMSGIDITYDVAKKLDFKFAPKAGPKTGKLFIQAGHYYLWRAGEPLRLQMSSAFNVGSEYKKHVLDTLKSNGADKQTIKTISEESGIDKVFGTITLMTQITKLHHLQNHMRELYYQDLNVDMIK